MRDPITNSLAIAAMPGLAKMAEDIDKELPQQRRSRRDTTSLLVLSGMARAMQSQEAAASAVKHTPLWEMVRASAASVGRELPERPPSADSIDRWLANSDGQLGIVAERALNPVAMALAHKMGLLLPSTPFSVDGLARAQHLTCDGTVAKPLSRVDETNLFTRSRAANPETGARIGNQYIGKNDDPNQAGSSTDDPKNRGLPFVVASTHTGRRHGRLIFGFETYQDGDEIAAATELFDRVIPLADGGIHWLHYDRLMNDTHVEQFTRNFGVIPIIEMHKADPRSNHAQAVAADDERFMRGKHGQHAPKERLRGTHYGTFRHVCADGQGVSLRLWMLDGELRVTRYGLRELSLDADPLRLVTVERRRSDDGRYQMLTTYELPCPSSPSCTITVDLAQQPAAGETDANALAMVTAGKVRILNERNPAFWEVAGRRSDSESVMSTIKRTFPQHGRASRLHLGAFTWDLVGAALLSNAKAWDVHIAQHTSAGKAEFARQQKKFDMQVAA